MQPFLAFMMAHTCSAMTHLSAAVRDSGIDTINVLLEFRPDLVGEGYFAEISQHYVEALGRSNRGRTLTAGSLKNLLAICEGCQTFLRATLPYVGQRRRLSGPGVGVGLDSGYGLGLGGCTRSAAGGVDVGRGSEESGLPVVLNRRQCEWNPARGSGSGSGSRSGGGSDGDTGGAAAPAASASGYSTIAAAPSAAATAASLVALLLDCWEECGLVSQEDDMEVARGVRSNADRAKLAKASVADARTASAKKSLGEKCGVYILECCTLLISNFKAGVLSDDSSAKIFARVYPTYPNRARCAVSASAAELIATTIAELHVAGRTFDQGPIDSLAAWSSECLASDFSMGVKVSLAIMSFAGPDLRAVMLQRAFDAWQKCIGDNSSRLVDPVDPVDPLESLRTTETKNLGLKMVRTLVEAPFEPPQLASLDSVLAAWVGEIPSLLWKMQKTAASSGTQYTYTLGLSVLLHVSRFVGSAASRRHLPALCAELEQLSIKIAPLFGLQIKEKVRPGPLTKMPEALQALAVEVLFNLPGLDNAVVGAADLSLSFKSPARSGASDRLLDLIYFKSQFGDPKKVWSFIYSAMERGDALDRVSRLAIHCSPPGAAIRALALPLLSKGNAMATYGALFFLRHCLTVFDDRDLGIEQPVLEAALRAVQSMDAASASASEFPASVSTKTIAHDVVLRLVRQVPSAIPTAFSFLPPDDGGNGVGEGHVPIITAAVEEALNDHLDLRPDVRAAVSSIARPTVSSRINVLLATFFDEK